MALTKPYRILDLFGGAGGAGRGYADAGFEVVGVDKEPQKHYPFPFVQMDALLALRTLLAGGYITDNAGHRWYLSDFDAIHASPPCQFWSAATNKAGTREKHLDLIGPVRPLLEQTGLPYVIENVPGAPLRDPALLCASRFLGTRCEWNGQTYELRRHRLFETNWPLAGTGKCLHHFPAFPVYGHGWPGNRPELKGAPVADLGRKIMHIPWMTRDELVESIPPYYATMIGQQLVANLSTRIGRAA